jgi:hypothetical protein
VHIIQKDSDTPSGMLRVHARQHEETTKPRPNNRAREYSNNIEKHTSRIM